jgi:hypothetical protein
VAISRGGILAARSRHRSCRSNCRRHLCRPALFVDACVTELIQVGQVACLAGFPGLRTRIEDYFDVRHLPPCCRRDLVGRFPSSPTHIDRRNDHITRNVCPHASTCRHGVFRPNVSPLSVAPVKLTRTGPPSSATPSRWPVQSSTICPPSSSSHWCPASSAPRGRDFSLGRRN